MPETLSTLVVAAVSAAIGYVFSVWQNRSRPWVSLLEFGSGTTHRGDTVDVPKQLSELTRDSRVVDFVATGPSPLGAVTDMRQANEAFLAESSDAFETLVAGIQSLRSAATLNDIKTAVWSILNPGTLQSLLELLLQREDLRLPDVDPAAPTRIPYADNPGDKSGCFVFHFGFGTMLFGSEFGRNPFARQALQPMAELVSKLERDKLLLVFEQLLPALKEQLQLSRSIEAEATKLTESYSRWTAEVTVMNFGAWPFLLFADETELQVRGKRIQPAVLKCQLLRQTEDTEDHRDYRAIEGAVCLSPGHSEKFFIVTRNTQGQMGGQGDVLRGVFKSGEATGRVRLRMLGKELPVKRWVGSTPLPFQDTETEEQRR